MDDFETAIMLSLDPTVSGEVKEKANRYCDSVRTTPDAWKFCVEKIYKTSTMQVKFFCFQVLQDLVLHGYCLLLLLFFLDYPVIYFN
jgi:exportin-T